MCLRVFVHTYPGFPHRVVFLVGLGYIPGENFFINWKSSFMQSMDGGIIDARGFIRFFQLGMKGRVFLLDLQNMAVLIAKSKFYHPVLVRLKAGRLAKCFAKFHIFRRGQR